MGILEKIQEVEREIARTQKNKGVSLKGSICVELYKTNNVVIQHYIIHSKQSTCLGLYAVLLLFIVMNVSCQNCHKY